MTSKIITPEILAELKQELPYKWRVQSFSAYKPEATCVAYVDARQVMDLLDEVVGVENWQSDYKEIKDNMYAGIGIKINDEWVWKWDCGTESNTEKEKGESSDSFKRAAVKWGVARFLYTLGMQKVKASCTKEKDTKANALYPTDDQNNRIWDLSKHINNINKNKKKKVPSVLKSVLKQVNDCKNLDDLRIIRQDNQDLETTNKEYKNALLAKFNILKDQEV